MTRRLDVCSSVPSEGPEPPAMSSARRSRTSLYAIFFPVATVMLGVPASAQEKKIQASSASVEEARERFGKGVQLYREGSLEAALAEFEKAAQLAPSYRLHYNIAQVQYELHNYVGAMRAFRRYLAQGGEQITGDRRAKVEAEIAELEGRVAHLAVNTNVPGAVIAVDEVRVGMAPLNGAVLINPGVRRVSALKPGHLPATVTVTAAGGERIDVALELAPTTSPDSGRVVLPLSAVPDLAVATPAPPPPRIKTWLSILTTATLAAGAGGFALLARKAEGEFEAELNRVPNTRSTIEDARSRMVNYAALTDALTVGSLVAGGVALYLGLSEGRPASKEVGARPRRPGISLSPTPGGLQAIGRF
jgi:tetratricopeptide (TPR) repeat protein